MKDISEAPRVAVITGASAGVGRAVAQQFAARGWRIGLIARGRAGLEGARADVDAAGARPWSCPPMSPMRRRLTMRPGR
ncbi:SDR family NAD(P)-dependent oxidoreductase [Paracoccus aerius]